MGALLLLGARIASAVTVVGVRTGDDDERTRIVLDLDAMAPETRVLDAGPDREVVVLLPGLRRGDGVPAGIPAVGRLAGGELQDEASGLRLALRFRGSSALRAFALENPDRLVFDLIDREAEGGASEPGAEASARDGSRDSGEPPTPIDSAPGPKRSGPRIVVIDAGHGGEDPGAVGPGVREKDVCLDVARRLHKTLSAEPGIHPILTRSRDVFLPLQSRVRLADEAAADLFVSIHVNAARTATAHGVEVFFLSIRGASDEAAQELARLENEALSAAEIPEVADGQEIPFSLSLRQSDTLLRSSHAAEVVLDSFVGRNLAENRGVRQANFSVLRSYLVPSVLVELGFVSSPSDRKLLAAADHRSRLAAALADGIVQYFREYAPLRRQGTP